ncbi:MAG: hypothetical protein JNK89_05390 [Saprospiraceae bacterium]|nr:hypothetical protein [Saprospiraceae bacterium]
MPSSRFAGLVLLVLLAFFGHGALSAQAPDLRQDQAFFQAKLPEYQSWLHQNQLDGILYAEAVSSSPQTVTLYLRAAFQGGRVCDSLQCAWEKLENASYRINGRFFHEQLLHKWAFLAEVHEDQAEVVVRCHDPAHFYRRISSRNGMMPVDGRNVRSGAVVDVRLPAALQGIGLGTNSMLLPARRVHVVCTKARRYLANYYRNKGTPVLWKARVDSSFTAVDEFVLEVTHLSYEICPDGFFEYHRIYVRGVQKGDDVELSWEFQGKYGSGIIFPPRKNDYKDMGERYKNNLDEYQRHLFKKLLDYLRQ